jgi:competence protein ComEA
MPTRAGRPDPTAADLAQRLSALRLPTVCESPPVSTESVRGGWLPDQARPVDPQPPKATAAAEGLTVPPSITSLLRATIEDRLPLWMQGITERVGRRVALTILAAVAVAVAVAIVGGVAVVHHRSAAPAYAGSTWPGSTSTGTSDSPESTSSTGSTASAGASASGSIVVDVGGKVRRPGLVTLPPGSRVADAIAAAGGALRRRYVATVDLAAKVGDGQLLLIGTAGSGGAPSTDPATGSGAGPVAPVNLSSADETTLETLPGIGPVTAQKIIDWRTAHNGFTNIEQLQQVPGIGPAHYAEIKSLVTP